MNQYIVYTTAKNSFIVPKDQFDAKRFTHSYEVESPIELATRKVKLPVRVTEASQVGELLKVLVMKLEPEEEQPS